MRVASRIAAAMEGAAFIDPVAEKLRAAAARIVPEGPVKDTLAGRFLGHPLHAALVSGPIGFLAGATLLDLIGRDDSRAASRRLIGAGLVAAAPTAAAGLADWTDTAGPERRVGLVHAAINTAALGLYAWSWLSGAEAAPAEPRHWPEERSSARAAGSAVISPALGVGVDTTAFQAGPDGWTFAADSASVVEGKPLTVEIAGVSVAVVRAGGELFALANRCTHRGGPLAEGSVENGCITCPWHGSRFSLPTGEVERGPAVYSQPVYDVRDQQGSIEVRRREHRTLRSNPVGAG